MVEKTLVFHFYVPCDYKENSAIRMHLECLKMYSHVFNHAIFIISVDDKTIHFVEEVEKDLICCGFSGDVRFVVSENDAYCEARTFNEWIYKKLNHYDGLVFFGHTKGVTNVVKYSDYSENTMQWIFALYFYSFEFIEEMEAKMIFAAFGYFRTFFGPLLMKCPQVDGVDSETAHYPGTFYWMNTKRLYDDIESGRAKKMSFKDRFFAEEIPTSYKFYDYAENLDSRMSMWMNHTDLYHCDFSEIIKFYGDYDLFYEKYNEIRKNI